MRREEREDAGFVDGVAVGILFAQFPVGAFKDVTFVLSTINCEGPSRRSAVALNFDVRPESRVPMTSLLNRLRVVTQPRLNMLNLISYLLPEPLMVLIMS